MLSFLAELQRLKSLSASLTTMAAYFQVQKAPQCLMHKGIVHSVPFFPWTWTCQAVLEAGKEKRRSLLSISHSRGRGHIFHYPWGFVLCILNPQAKSWHVLGELTQFGGGKVRGFIHSDLSPRPWEELQAHSPRPSWGHGDKGMQLLVCRGGGQWRRATDRQPLQQEPHLKPYLFS